MLVKRPFKRFSEEESEVWQILWDRQYPHIQGRASQYWSGGVDKLGLTRDGIPDFEQMDKRFQDLVGWELVSTEVVFSDGQTWFEALVRKEFLITEYIREKDSLDYTPLPDIYHDAFGHLPLMASQRYADMVHRFAEVVLHCPQELRKEIGSVWWYTIEFGMIQEDDELKAFGAGLMSSYGEFDHAFSDNIKRLPFDPAYIRQVAPSPHEFHKELFVLESIDQIDEFIEDWDKNYNPR